MRYATIGTSWITDDFIEASKMVDDFQLYAVYSRSRKKAEQFAEQHQASKFFTNLDNMTDCDDIDCVYIASPNSLHYEHAIKFLESGKHVICEKPIFSNTTELNEALDVAKDNNVYLFEAIRSIHSPNFITLKDNLHIIGNPRSCMLHYTRYSSKYDGYLRDENPNVFSLEFSGGALADMGVYPLYLAVALFGKPERISYNPVILESGVDGSGTLNLIYDQFICTVMCSKISTSKIPCEIHGESGTLSFDNPALVNNLKFTESKTDKHTAIESNAVEHDMAYEIKTFKNMILNNDDRAFNHLMDLSLSVLSIMEEARHQNGIIFGSEKV